MTQLKQPSRHCVQEKATNEMTEKLKFVDCDDGPVLSAINLQEVDTYSGSQDEIIPAHRQSLLYTWMVRCASAVIITSCPSLDFEGRSAATVGVAVGG